MINLEQMSSERTKEKKELESYLKKQRTTKTGGGKQLDMHGYSFLWDNLLL